jgi:cytochrome c556
MTSDVIAARRSHGSIMNNMDKIRGMISGAHRSRRKPRNAHTSPRCRRLSRSVSAGSNQWKEDVDLDPVKDIWSPDIWTEFADFSRRAAAAANTALELRRADNEDDVKRLYRALGIACDTCHALYMKE